MENEESLRDLMLRAGAAFGEPDFELARRLYGEAYRRARTQRAPTLIEREYGERCAQECREYLIVLPMMRDILAANKLGASGNKQRMAELALLATHCALTREHNALVLKMAINAVAKLRNYAQVNTLAARLGALHPGPELTNLAATARRVAEARGGRDDVPMPWYEPTRPFRICPGSLTPIYTDCAYCTVECPYCRATYNAQFAGTLCVVCGAGDPLSTPVLSGPGVDGRSQPTESARR